jgi:hypothetical protein
MFIFNPLHTSAFAYIVWIIEMEAKQYGTNILVLPWEDKPTNTHRPTTKNL